MESNIITVSRMRSFNACRRLHSIKYELGYRSLAKSENLSFGSLIHVGLEAWWKSGGSLPAALAAMQAQPGDCDAIDMAKATVLMTGYDARWLPDMADIEVSGVETEFKTRIINPATGCPMHDLEVAGKLDVIARRRSTGKVWFFEHKTSSEDLAAGSTYWQRLRMDPQVSVYHGGMKALGHDVEGCVYDVLSKFGERPKLATPMDKRKYTKDGRLYAAQRENDETVEEFSSRIATKMAESPDSYFGRAEVVRTDAELMESQKDVHATALMIRDEERLGRAPRNPNQCFMYGRTCEFHEVCSGCGSLDDETRFKKLDNLHPELDLSNNQ
jgi:hypothetical protein